MSTPRRVYIKLEGKDDWADKAVTLMLSLIMLVLFGGFVVGGLYELAHSSPKPKPVVKEDTPPKPITEMPLR